ncbi:response regulator [Bosea sp. PAMC 26642]|uniref:response regulator n=1 Tax=Bosea sp. (strain PAMC 26642) TaxID=1792307 RepID=UPI0007703B27|nr:response regulator [Bosea sp. PAMC 26642]AMJ61774.1 two-component system response regulator [Bosea sp. PAMC 26642]
MSGSPNARPPRLIVVDDEEHLRDMVAEYLEQSGYSVRTASGGGPLDLLLGQDDADLLLLDVHMPGEDGLSIARRIRAGSTVPIILLTAASDIVDKIVGLEIGADDYMTKPFDLRELRARVRALLRRRHLAVPAVSKDDVAESQRLKKLPFGKVFLDVEARCLLRDDGASETLTAMEFDLIQVFVQNPDRVLTRDRLLDLAHNRDNSPFDRSIDVRVTRIRKKIEIDPAKPQTIKTVRGAGYIYTPGKRPL